MLNYYITQTQRLLQNPGAPTSLYSASDITSYINTMRGQLAAQSFCIRRLGTISTVNTQRPYFIGGITISDTAVAGALNIRTIMYGSGSGTKMVYNRPWEWFQQYNLNTATPSSGAPVEWAQLGQGGSSLNTPNQVGTMSSGTFYLDPIPDGVYNLTIDCACYPISLASDSDAEAIPYEWTDAIPFGAAWMALLAAQTTARRQDAEAYFQYFQQYVQRARDGATPPVLRFQFEQVPDPTNLSQMGLPQGRGAAQ